MKKTTPPRPAKIKSESLSEFRYQLRRFLRLGESATKAEGITPLQYLLMLHVRGFPGRDWARAGELAERLQLQHHGVVALLSRCEVSGLVMRRKSDIDRRQVDVHPTALGARFRAADVKLRDKSISDVICNQDAKRPRVCKNMVLPLDQHEITE